MAEVQITDMPAKAAPNSRRTKDSERFTLLAVNATFDGSAASAAFLPAVEVVSDSGVVVARHVAGESVAAGGSAEVTFAPFLRGAAATGGGAHALETLSDGTGVSIVGGGSDFLPWVHNSGSTLLDVTTPTGPKVIADGVYTFACVVTQTPSSGAANVGRVSPVFFLPGLGVLPAAIAGQIVAQQVGVFGQYATVTMTAEWTAGTTVRALAGNSWTIATTFQLGAYVEQVG